ncbi:MAG: HD domain-containing protein [Candidatus Obscuribacterales bacterium]|nr:HD domain-containing protein [Candidatus Obscuribacterales bacterium]
MTIALVEKLSDVRDFRKILETTVKEIGETYNADLSQIVLSNPLDTNITSICEYLSNPDEIPRAPALTTFPLTLEGGGLGVLNIARNENLSLDEVNEIRITLAEISNIIRYAQINDLVQRDTFRSAFMSEISSMMQMNMGLGDTLFMVVNILGKALNCSRCIFVATDGSSGWKCYEYWQRERGVESSQDCGWPTKDSAVVARALLSPLPVVTFEGQTGSYLTPAQEEMQFIGVRSLLAVGIRSTLGVHGCIIMQQCDSRRAWTRDEMDMVQNVADTVADALVQLPDEKRNLEPIMRLHQRNVADTKDAEQQSIQDVRRALKGVLANASIPNARKAPTVAAPQEPEEGYQQQGYQHTDYEQGIPPTPEQLAYAIESSGESTNAFGGLADMLADQAQQPVIETETPAQETPQVMMPSPPPFDPTAPGQGGRTLTGLLGGIRTNARTGAASVGAWNITTSQPTPPMPGEEGQGDEGTAQRDEIQPFEVQAEEAQPEETRVDDIEDRILAAIDAPAVDNDQAVEEGSNPIPKAFSGSWGLTDEYTKAKALQNAPTPASMRPAKSSALTPAASVQPAEPSSALNPDDLNAIPTPSVRSPGAPPKGLGQALGRASVAPEAAPVVPTPEPPPAPPVVSSTPDPVSTPSPGPGRPGPGSISRSDLDAIGAPGALAKPKPASKWGDLESIPSPGTPAAAAAQVTPAMDFPEDQSSSGNWGNLDAIPTPTNNPGKGLGGAMLGKARMASISTPGGGLGSSFHKDRNRSGQFIDGPPLEIDEAAAEAKLKQILSTSNPTSDYIFATPGIDPRLLGRLDNWVSQVEQKDKYVNGHARAVAEYSSAVGRLLGLTPEEVNVVRLAAIVHDIGKMKLPQSLLQKPDDDLSDAELVQTMEHPIDGAKLLKGIPELEELASVVLYHHEEYDGNGYPEGLAGEDIPLLSRIVHAADGYHGRVSDLTYRAGMPPEDALEEMRQNAGILYDPAVVEALIACISQGLVPPII